MSDVGEKTCPLCAEEMDLTDQQLKPCKCGYEICIWCWHHIIDMAEKDETEGRCPACRTPYNKEKVKGTEANCERIVAEMNMEKKHKTQKAKNKTSEGRKQLSSVRVIQRNLVYIVGLPLYLADEDLMQRKEYFGQYGKVLKVSISRTAAGAIQQFSNNTCSIYITYSKDEEAVRCIQCVHGFVLEDRSLRACFGTTKYCHAWLRNMPCSNPDCLYLHEIAPHEDSFSKDEIVSAFTRSRVQQITGATNNIQRRSGNVLPPPADDYCNNSSGSSGKPMSKSSLNNIDGSARVSPPNSSSGRSGALPAAASWGMRAFNSQPLHTSLACSEGADKQKADACGGSMAFSTAVASSTQPSVLQGDLGKKLIIKGKSGILRHKDGSELLEPAKEQIGTDQAFASEGLVSPRVSTSSTIDSQLYRQPASKDKNISMPPNTTNSFNLSGHACSPDSENELDISVNGTVQSLCSDMSSMSIDRHSWDEDCDGIIDYSLSGPTLIKSPIDQGLQQSSEQFKQHSIAKKAVTSTKNFLVSREQYDAQSDSQTKLSALHQVEEEDMLSFDVQRLKDPEVDSCTGFALNSSHSFDLSTNSKVYSSQHSEGYGSNYFNADPQLVDKSDDNGLLQHSFGVSPTPNEYPENLIISSADRGGIFEDSHSITDEGKGMHMGRFQSGGASVNQNAAVDMGESSIISNILSMDFDAWDESLTSPQNLARLMGKTDKQQGCIKVSNSRKVQNSNQSRFSFARQDESKSQLFDDEPRFSNSGHVQKNPFYNYDNVDARDSYYDSRGHSNGFTSLNDNVNGRDSFFDGRSNGFSSFNVEEADNFPSNNSQVYPNNFPTSRAQMSAPPGFSMLSRAAPPGFSSQERVEQAFDMMSGNYSLDNSSSRNSYPAPPSGNVGSALDIEFMDPAILAVGKGSRLRVGHANAGLDMRSNFPTHLSAFENEARLQLLMQRSFPPNQNLRYTDMAENFVPVNDSYGIPTRHLGTMEQSQATNLSPFSQLSRQQSRSGLMSNGHWDGWNEVQSGYDLGMPELLRAERLGLNKFYSGYEDSKIRMSGSGNLYNRTFGI